MSAVRLSIALVLVGTFAGRLCSGAPPYVVVTREGGGFHFVVAQEISVNGRQKVRVLLQRILPLPRRTQKVVAPAHHHLPRPPGCARHLLAGFRARAFYLHAFLGF